MQYRREYRFGIPDNGGRGRSPFNFGGILVGIIALILIFVVARFVFRLLYFLAPILLIATAIMDYRVLLGYGRWIGNMLRQNILLGIGAIVLTIVGFPIVAAGLFGKALLNRQLRKAPPYEQQQQPLVKLGEYVEFEEVPDDKALRLPKIEKKEAPPRILPKKDNEYDSFFK